MGEKPSLRCCILKDDITCIFLFGVFFMWICTLIKKKTKFPSYIRKSRREQLQSHMWPTASSYMTLQPLPSEFPYTYFYLYKDIFTSFFQCTFSRGYLTELGSGHRGCLHCKQITTNPTQQKHPLLHNLHQLIRTESQKMIPRGSLTYLRLFPLLGCSCGECDLQSYCTTTEAEDNRELAQHGVLPSWRWVAWQLWYVLWWTVHSPRTACPGSGCSAASIWQYHLLLMYVRVQPTVITNITSGGSGHTS